MLYSSIIVSRRLVLMTVWAKHDSENILFITAPNDEKLSNDATTESGEEATHFDDFWFPSLSDDLFLHSLRCPSYSIMPNGKFDSEPGIRDFRVCLSTSYLRNRSRSKSFRKCRTSSYNWWKATVRCWFLRWNWKVSNQIIDTQRECTWRRCSSNITFKVWVGFTLWKGEKKISQNIADSTDAVLASSKNGGQTPQSECQVPRIRTESLNSTVLEFRSDDER